MSYYKVKGQSRFLEMHLRGTGRTLTEAQASARYGSGFSTLWDSKLDRSRI